MSFWAHHLTTIISVTLVLLLMGIIAMIWISAESETRRLKEKIELSVILRDSVPPDAGQRIAKHLAASPYAANVRIVSKEEALRVWASETGEDLQALFGVNPLSEEVSFTLKSEYASAPAISSIKRELERDPHVEGVSAPEKGLVEAMNRNISRLTWILGIVAGIMLVISVVLINNTVHLTIYSRRFTIHTMQLVGATPGFIRRPVILNNMLAGLLAGVIASAFIAAGVVAAGKSALPGISSYIGWDMYAVVSAGLVMAGMALCALAAWLSANAYLRKDYDALFK